MIDWEELESPKEAPQASKSDAVPAVDVPPVSLSANAIAHWRRNLERFAPGHIGYEYAKQALARLERNKSEIDTSKEGS